MSAEDAERLRDALIHAPCRVRIEQAEAHVAVLRKALVGVHAALQRLMIPAQHWTAGNEAVERETETVIAAALAATPADSAAERAALRRVAYTARCIADRPVLADFDALTEALAALGAVKEKR